MTRLPRIHSREKRDSGKLFTVERLDLEFPNGERRVYERLISHGLGAVIVVALQDDDTWSRAGLKRTKASSKAPSVNCARKPVLQPGTCGS